MNESEVEEHRIESGEEFLLITAKVIFFCSRESESGRRNQRIEIGEKFLLITAKVHLLYQVVKVNQSQD